VTPGFEANLVQLQPSVTSAEDAGVYSLRESCSSAQRNCLAARNNPHLCVLGSNWAVNATLKFACCKKLLKFCAVALLMAQRLCAS